MCVLCYVRAHKHLKNKKNTFYWYLNRLVFRSGIPKKTFLIYFVSDRNMQWYYWISIPGMFSMLCSSSWSIIHFGFTHWTSKILFNLMISLINLRDNVWLAHLKDVKHKSLDIFSFLFSKRDFRVRSIKILAFKIWDTHCHNNIFVVNETAILKKKPSDKI